MKLITMALTATVVLAVSATAALAHPMHHRHHHMMHHHHHMVHHHHHMH